MAVCHAIIFQLLWTLVDGQQCAGSSLPENAREDCTLGGCCQSKLTPQAAAQHSWWIELAQARVGYPGSLLSLLANVEPMGATLGVYNLLESPKSVPVLNGGPLDLAMSLNVLRISEINQKSQTFKMQYELTWVWRDCRALFNCSNIVTLSDADALSAQFWTPRWRIKELEDDKDYLRRKDFQIVGNGMVVYKEYRLSTLRCSFDFTDLPFDTQNCKVSLHISGKPESEMRMKWAEVTAEELTNAEWKIQQGKDWSIKASSKQTLPSQYSQQYYYSELSAEFTLTRDHGYLWNNFVGIVILFYVLSYIGLYIDVAAAPARVAAGVIPALTTSNKMSALASALPPISYGTRLGAIMDFNLLMIVIHFIEYGFVHWAAKTVKAEAAKKQDVEGGEVIVEPGWRRFYRKAAHFIHAYLELTTRILSPIVYFTVMIAFCVK